MACSKMAKLEKDLAEIVVAGHKISEYETSSEETVVAGPKMVEH